jgi:putative membrane protein
MSYLVFKSIHIVAVLAWSAGLFYIGRLFVYYVEASHQDTKQTLATMAIRLSRYIMLPASIITLVVGLHMAGMSRSFSEGWFHLKLALLIGLFGYQHFVSKIAKQLIKQTFNKSSRWCRCFNEVPIVLITGICFSVITKSIQTSIIAMAIIFGCISVFFFTKKLD